MPLTNPTSTIVRGALQDVSVRYRNQAYVADRVFPIIDGISRKTKVAKYAKGQWFRDEAEPRAPGAAARVSLFDISSQNLDPINYAIATQVTDEEREEANKPGNLPIQPDIDANEYMADKLDIKREVRAAAVLQAAVWSGVAAGGEDAEGNWGNATASSDTTLADIMLARDTILSNTGLLPNKILMSWKCWSDVQVAPALLALMNPQQLSANSILQPSTFGALVGLEVIIATAVRNSAEHNVGDTAFTSYPIWGTGATDKGVAFVYYAPPTPGLKIASAGYQYRVRNEQAGGSRLITTWRDDARHADMYDAQEEVDISAVCLDAGYLFKDTATT